MLAPIIGTFGPFLDYFRPSKSPYLLATGACAFAICAQLELQWPHKLGPGYYFIPLYILLCFLITLSLSFGQHGAPHEHQADQLSSNSDSDGIFKFSRVLGLSLGAIMFYYFWNNNPNNGFIFWTTYWIILIHLSTFILYMTFRHFKEEDSSNIAVFQIALMSAIVFACAVYTGTRIKDSDLVPLQRCGNITYTLRVDGSNTVVVGPIDCATAEEHLRDRANDTRFEIISKNTVSAPDFRQMSFLVFVIAWLVYEFYWLRRLVKMLYIRVIF